MITWKDLYAVLTAVVPLYTAMILAYGSVRWWKIFTPDQCSGINRFVAIFAVPLLSFHFISTSNPYGMNLRFIAADTLQKLIILVVLGIWNNWSRYGSLDWVITIFSLSTLPNTLVVGIPLLVAMYGQFCSSLMVQVVVLQCIIWYTLLLFFFEFRGAKLLIADQFPGKDAADIASIKVDADVVSLDGHEFLQTNAEVGNDGKLHVTVRKSNASRPSYALTPRRSNLSGADIYSLNSSMNPTPRASNFDNSDFHSMVARPALPPTRNSRLSNFDENSAPGAHAISSPTRASYPAPNPEIATNNNARGGESRASHDAKEIHMFVWSSSASPVSEGCGPNVMSGRESAATEQSRRSDHGVKEISVSVPDADPPQNMGIRAAITESIEESDVDNFSCSGREDTREEKVAKTDLTNSPMELQSKEIESGDSSAGKQMPPANVVTRLILIMVWRKLIRNPNSYSSLIGLVWSLIAFRWDVTMPKIIDKSIAILSDAGLGMAMFSLGLFMALQPKIIACGKSATALGMVIRFIAGPAVMAAASFVVGCRGVLLRVAIVQAALPQGIVPFVFAKEYDVHPTILSTAVIFGMLVTLPITLTYYFLLEL